MSNKLFDCFDFNDIKLLFLLDIVKNIIFFIPNLQYGGTEKVASLLSGELSKSHNVEVVALQNKCEYLKLHKDVALHVLLPSEIEKGKV